MTKKNRPPYNPISAVRSAIRRAFSRSPVVQEMTRENVRRFPKFRKNGTRAKVDGTEHLCALCKQWKRGKVSIDHIVPVVDPEIGFIGFDEYFKRMFCDRSNLQKLCSDCHNVKTAYEWKQRRLKTAWDELNAFVTSLSQDLSDKNRLGVHKALKKFTPKRLSNMVEDQNFLMKLSALRESVQPLPKAAKQRKKRVKPTDS